MVECNLAKVEVAGSNPVSRSILFERYGQRTLPFFVQKFSSAFPEASGSIKGLHTLFAFILIILLTGFAPFFWSCSKCLAKPLESPSRVTRTAGGQIDMCLSCHDERPDKAHGRKVLGCFSCHLGDPLAGTPELAHKGMIYNPGELAVASRTCGQEGCHVDQVQRAKKSLMATNRGIITTLRFYWKETKDHNEDLTVEKLIKSCLDSPATDYFRKLCGTCHLWLERHRLPSFLVERGGGCTACHYYKPPRQKNGRKPDHPFITRHIPMENCVRCHNRSGRIGLAYQGMYEAEGYGTPFQDGDFSEDQLHDGRFVKRLSPDVHFQKGLICIDCHSQKEVMGDGKERAHFEQQLEITCSTCHGGRTKLQKIFQENQKKPKFPVLTNLVKKEDVFFLKGKNDGKLHPLDPFLQDECRHKTHQRLSCQSCHSRWVPQCYGCHVINDKSREQLDKLSLKKTPGLWQEFRSYMRYEAPALGVKRQAHTGRDEVVILVPG